MSLSDIKTEIKSQVTAEPATPWDDEALFMNQDAATFRSYLDPCMDAFESTHSFLRPGSKAAITLCFLFLLATISSIGASFHAVDIIARTVKDDAERSMLILNNRALPVFLQSIALIGLGYYFFGRMRARWTMCGVGVIIAKSIAICVAAATAGAFLYCYLHFVLDIIHHSLGLLGYRHWPCIAQLRSHCKVFTGALWEAVPPSAVWRGLLRDVASPASPLANPSSTRIGGVKPSWKSGRW